MAKILVVDDDRTTTSIIKLHISNLGHDIAGIAYTAKEAINLARESMPDLALIDINLGIGADGIDTALVISKYMDIPIVFVTAYSDSQTLRRAKIVRPQGFVNKPLRQSDIKTAIEFAISSKPKKLYKDGDKFAVNNALQYTYRLTPAESRVTIMLMQCPQPSYAAEALNISIATVRTHLKHIYQKTNTNSKAMLIREIQTGPVAKLINEQ